MSQADSHIASADKRQAGPGRPRSFDEAAALDAAMRVFWEKGFEATSLDDLTKAMGLSRSSFYAAFGCKQTLFLRAVEHYSRKGIQTLKEVADEAGDEAVDAILQALANPEGGNRGCLLINCITELAPHDEKVAELGRRHIDHIEEIFAKAIDPAHPDTARDKASAYYSLAIGTLALRKAGIAPERIARTLQQARSVLPD
ncbi:TetR/AcrR family transcriptional regulator [Roseibium sediminicola]|uniref:TetR/AcrR family transcriptional regulator n=1 Tax=Roseibium sediminicola TaxID=2933272 RepID=A0ABT0GZC5_9HYPH|nr:TetR/AcrR family transcriptional regulator [Roseibium sp. CAU 1639]MCK7614783.1 TetR/AcrR family transcriptional regulator [Roseibium sp. CAU 1639]